MIHAIVVELNGALCTSIALTCSGYATILHFVLASFHELLELGIVGAVTNAFSATEISNRCVAPETL